MTPEAVALFLGAEWRVSPKSDRMGYRLEGPKLAHVDGFNIVSDGTVPGSIQVPGNGQPLALLADRGTTGGYPKIATIITADLPRFAQTQAGGRVRFASLPDRGGAKGSTPLRHDAGANRGACGKACAE